MFIKLAVPTYIKNYMGLKLAEGKAFRFGSDYYYLEIPLLNNFEPGTMAPKGKWLEVKTAATVRPRKSRVLVVVNPAILRSASVNPTPIIEAVDGETLVTVIANFHKDLDLSTVGWAVRLYLLD